MVSIIIKKHKKLLKSAKTFFICFLSLVFIPIYSASLLVGAEGQSIIITINDPGYSEEGNWRDSSLLGYNGLPTRYGSAGSSAKWTPELTAGYYKVSIYKIVHENGAPEAKIEVVHGKGVDTHIIDYTSGVSEWVELGTYFFETGSQGYVKLTADQYPRASAVQFEKVDDVVSDVKTGSKQVVFPDVQGTIYEEAVQMLTSLNILAGTEDGMFRPEDTISRAEFSLILAKAIGLGEVIFSGSSKFEDVDENHYAWSEINLLSQMGIVGGISEDIFAPEETITYQQAIKMIVSALGYDLYAKNNGGYPVGYVVVAAEKGIMKNIELAYDSDAKRGLSAIMVYNALFVDLMQATGFGQEIQYSIMEGKTLLTEKFNIYKLTGKITANGLTRLVGESNLREDEVEINGEIYKIGYTNADTLIGCYATCYYRINKNTDEKIIIKIDVKDHNNVITIQDEYIKSFLNRVYTYESEEENLPRLNEAKISAKADIIYNGKSILYDEKYMKPTNGNVVLIDSDKNNEYDTVIITQYETLVINSINKEDQIISGKYGALPLKLDTKGSSKKILIQDESGEEIEINNLKEWDVLSIASSLDEKYTKIIVGRNSVKGTVFEVAEEGSKTILTIDDLKYKVSDSYPNEGAYSINMGDSGVFYFDITGRIAAFEASGESLYKFGYLVKGTKRSGVANGLELKIFSSEDGGKMVDFKTAEKIKIDGTTYRVGQDDLAMLENGDMLIRYTTDSNGLIRAIDTKNQGKNEETNSLYISHPFPSSPELYISYHRTFNRRAIINNKTLVFLVPSDRDEYDSYQLKDFNYFRNSSRYTVEAYNTSRDTIFAEALVVISSYGGGQGINNDSVIAVVDKITKSIDQEGNPVEKIYLGTNGEIKSLLSYEDNFFTARHGIGTGDVIRYGTNYRGYIDDIDFVYDYDENTRTGKMKGGSNIISSYTAQYNLVCGYVYSIKDGVLQVTTEDPKNYTGDVPETDLINFMLSKYKMVLYDSTREGNKVIKATLADILDYKHYPDDCSKILIQTRYGDSGSMIIYK